MKQLLVLGVCALIFACGASTEERGIASTTADSTASGSAYNSNDGFAPAGPAKATAPATATPAAAAPADTVSSPAAAPAVSPAAGTPAAAAAAPAAAAAKPAAKPAAADNSEDIKRGEALIAKSDCFACHKVDAKLLGPSYKDVAAKYPDNAGTIAQLAGKIKNGGSGVWGAIPMSPHPTLSDDDAKAMVKYILSLK
jgi:cytochrome c